MEYLRKEWIAKASFRLAWIAWLILFLWIVAKLFGFINTPEWVNLIPLAATTASLAAFLIGVGAYKNKVDSIEQDFNKLEKKIDKGFAKTNSQFQKAFVEMAGIKSDLSNIKNKLRG